MQFSLQRRVVKQMEAGCQVQTAYGAGTVVEILSGGEVTIELEQWKLADGKSPRLHTHFGSSAILSSSFCDIGSCVYTKYGPGVLFKFHREGGKHVVRLWRPRGLGAATAYMPRNDLVRVIKAMPGMTVTTAYGLGTVNMYHHERDSYTVQLPFGVAHLNAESIISCPEAIVLPTAEYLADLTLDNVNMKQMYADLSENSSVKSVMEPISVMIERFRGGQISSMDEVLSIRSKQLNEQVMQIDVNSLSKTLQDKIDSIADDSGKIEMLLGEGKKRIAALLENADSRQELASGTKTSLQMYLTAGKEQIDSVLGNLSATSSGQEQEAVKELRSLTADMHSSLSVIKNLAASDPVLEGLMAKLQSTNHIIAEKAHQLGGVLHGAEAVQVLESGGKDLSLRLANILDNCSGDVSEVKALGGNFLQALESQGAKDKGLALLDGVKTRILSSMQGTVEDESNPLSTQSLARSIESSLVTMLAKWKTATGGTEVQLQSQLTRLTALLSLVSEGQLTLSGTGTTSRDRLYSSLGGVRRSGNILAREQLARTLSGVKQAQESMSTDGRCMSGHQFFKQFLLEGSGDAAATESGSVSLFSAGIFRDTWTEATKVTSSKFKSIVENVDSPLLKDVAQPIGKVIDQISSGDFDVDQAIQAAKASLSSELLSSSAKDIVSTGDQVVSVLEQFREHDAVQGILDHLKDINLEEKASFLATFNPEDALTGVEKSLSGLTGIGKNGHVDAEASQEARNVLINTTKDKVLGFLLEHIPSMAIPDIQGVKDDVQFAVTGLDMSGFKLRKEDVQVRLGSSLKEEFLVCEATNISAAFKGVKWKYQQLYFPYLSGTGVADAAVLNASIRIGLKIIRVPKGTVRVMQSSVDRSATYDSIAVTPESDSNTTTHPDASANTIYTRFSNIRGVVDLHRQGAGTGMSKSSSDLNFQESVGGDELGASLWGEEVLSWEPVLIMTSQNIDIQHLSLKIDDSSLAWLYNLLASVFEGIIRDYVRKNLQDMLTSRCSTLLGMVNSTAVNYWPVIHSILKVDILTLKDATAKDMAMLLGPPRLPLGEATELEITPREYTLKFADSGPLGMKLDIFEAFPDEEVGDDTQSTSKSKKHTKRGSRVMVTGAVTGSQADKLLEQAGLRAFLDGASIVSVNGKSFKYLDEKAVLQSLKGSRPLYITLKLSMPSWERLGVHRSILAKEKGGAISRSGALLPPAGGTKAPANMRKLRVVKVRFLPGPLGLKLKETRSCGGAVIVTGFSRTSEDKPLQAELSGVLRTGMVMLSVSGEVVFGRPFEEVMEVIKSAKRPMDVMFVPSPDQQFTFTSPPSDLVLGRIEGFVMVAAFSHPHGPAQEEHPGICPGMVILQVNKEPVGAGMSLEEVEDLVNRPFQPHSDSDMGDKERSGTTTGSEAAGTIVPKTKLAMRDMDCFMHLLRIRDGSQSVDEEHIEVVTPQNC